MTVKLQIVGIFYQEEIDVTSLGDGPFSVKQIMDLAVQNGGVPADGNILNYSYAAVYGTDDSGHQTIKNYVDFISATYPNGATSPISGSVYSAGTYALSQNFTNFDVSQYTVWQYYIFKEVGGNNVVVAAGPSNETPFDQTQAVEDGYSIVWRLVTISAQAALLNSRIAAMLPKAASPKKMGAVSP